MLPVARDPSFQTEDISILKQYAVWNCVKMSMILLFYCDEPVVFQAKHEHVWCIIVKCLYLIRHC